MKAAVTYLAILSFALLGLVNIGEGDVKVGVATLCLSLANALLLL